MEGGMLGHLRPNCGLIQRAATRRPLRTGIRETIGHHFVGGGIRKEMFTGFYKIDFISRPDHPVHNAVLYPNPYPGLGLPSHRPSVKAGSRLFPIF